MNDDETYDYLYTGTMGYEEMTDVVQHLRDARDTLLRKIGQMTSTDPIADRARSYNAVTHALMQINSIYQHHPEKPRAGTPQDLPGWS